jgi:hypothetical protein
MLLNFDVNSNLILVRRFHTEKIVKMSQFYSDSFRFFATNCTKVTLVKNSLENGLAALILKCQQSLT